MKSKLLLRSPILATLLLAPSTSLYASNTITSNGVPGATITLDGVASPGEWNGAGSAQSTNLGNPLNVSVSLLHKADGLYVLAMINDATVNNSDQFNLRFDMNHDQSPTPDAGDFGVTVLRSGTATWGPADQDPATWSPVPASDLGVTSSPTGWVVEFHLPTGSPSNLTFNLGTIGVYFNAFDEDNAFGSNSAKYAQWPAPPAASPNDLLDMSPNQWANLIFDPKTTYPDISALDVRRGDAGAANYYNLNYAGVNSFEAEFANPGGTVIADASNVRINLYFAARGIGESWHRLDTNAVLTADCSAPDAGWNSTVVLKNAVCSGGLPLPDISTTTIHNVVTNMALYTIQNGQNGQMTRTGGNPDTIAAATSNYYPVIDWNTTPAQDPFFQSVTDAGTTYDRAHECMLAEAIVPNDPNPSNNTVQRNMNFVGVSGSTLIKFPFTLGWPGFAKYDPLAGKKMFLQVNRSNMGNIKFELPGVTALPGGNGYVAELKGMTSVSLQASIQAPSADVFGQTLKENLLVPAQAGGDVGMAMGGGSWFARLLRRLCVFFHPGMKPVWVKVPPYSKLWIVNYSLNDHDMQYVDVDGRGPLPATGPAGLPPGRVPPNPHHLLVPSARLGELVMSYDGFKTGIGIAEGVQVETPANVEALALAINDYVDEYKNNTGTGFRVKISVRPPTAAAEELPVATKMRAAIASPVQMASVVQKGYNAVPVLDLLPQVCVAGYEDIDQKRPVGGSPAELYRYIGNVCWGILDVLPEREAPRDKADTPPQRIP